MYRRALSAVPWLRERAGSAGFGLGACLRNEAQYYTVWLRRFGRLVGTCTPERSKWAIRVSRRYLAHAPNRGFLCFRPAERGWEAGTSKANRQRDGADPSGFYYGFTYTRSSRPDLEAQ